MKAVFSETPALWGMAHIITLLLILFANIAAGILLRNASSYSAQAWDRHASRGGVEAVVLFRPCVQQSTEPLVLPMAIMLDGDVLFVPDHVCKRKNADGLPGFPGNLFFVGRYGSVDPSL